MATKEEIASVLDHKPLTFEQMKEIEALYLQHDWEALRNQAAISCLSAIVGTMPKEVQGNYADVYAKEAVEYADALIEVLKKK